MWVEVTKRKAKGKEVAAILVDPPRPPGLLTKVPSVEGKDAKMNHDLQLSVG